MCDRDKLALYRVKKFLLEHFTPNPDTQHTMDVHQMKELQSVTIYDEENSELDESKVIESKKGIPCAPAENPVSSNNLVGTVFDYRFNSELETKLIRTTKSTKSITYQIKAFCLSVEMLLLQNLMMVLAIMIGILA